MNYYRIERLLKEALTEREAAMQLAAKAFAARNEPGKAYEATNLLKEADKLTLKVAQLAGQMAVIAVETYNEGRDA